MTSPAILAGELYMPGVNVLARGVGDDYRMLARERGGFICPREGDQPLTLTMMIERGREPLVCKPAERCTMARIRVIDPELARIQKREENRRHYALHKEEHIEKQRQYRARKKAEREAVRE